MARLPRLVLPGYPYHVTQRGNRRQQTFEDGDYQVYRDLLAEAADRAGAEVWAYCLMPNHVHLMVVPRMKTDYARPSPMRTGAIPDSSTRGIAGPGICGRARFGAVVMDEMHLSYAMRYVSLNPVRARLAARAETGAGRA